MSGPLEFPLVPTTESEVTTGDITWKWNGYAWYAASQGDDVYLSRVTDDIAKGAITFEQLTTHEGGVEVTGGMFGAEGTTPDQLNVGLSSYDGQLYLMSNGDPNARRPIAFQVGGKTQCAINSLGRFNSSWDNKFDTEILIGFQTTGITDGDASTTQVKKIISYRSDGGIDNAFAGSDPDNSYPRQNIDGYGFFAGSNYGRSNGISDQQRQANRLKTYYGFATDKLANHADTTYGFYSDVFTSATADQYNFFASGSAPNYFAGGVQFDLTHSQGGTQDQLILDKYEEGTFTTTSANSALDPFTKDGLSYYQLVGKTVTYAIRIGLNSNGNQTVPAGTYNVTGFPFTNVAANSGGVVTFIGTSNAFRGEVNASFTSNGPTLRFVVDSNINNVTLIRCTLPVFLT